MTCQRTNTWGAGHANFASEIAPARKRRQGRGALSGCNSNCPDDIGYQGHREVLACCQEWN